MAEYDERTFAESRHKDRSYARIGVYAYSREDGHENVCDVHVTWPAPQRHNPKLESRDHKTLTTLPATGKAWFSGGSESVRQVGRLGRSRREVEEYEWYRDVSPHLELAGGGQGLVVAVGNWPQVKPRAYAYSSKVHVWLFGPLVLDGRPYGSLFFELTGPFHRDMVFRPLALKGSTYSGGLAGFIPPYRTPPEWDKLTYEEKMARQARGEFPDNSYWEDMVVDGYNARVSGAVPVRPPGSATRWEWTVESYARNVTELQAKTSSG